MPKQRILTLTAFILVCGCLLYVGCSSDNTDNAGDTPKADDGKKQDGKNTTTAGPKPLLKGWEKPALALVISGEVHGYLEPCGCSETQSGGLARRADLFTQLRKDRGWDVAGLDLGGLLNPDRLQRAQSRIKFQTLKSAMSELGYASIGLGVEEVQVDEGSPYFMLTQQPPEEIVSNELRFLSANVQPYAADQVAFPQTHQIVTVGDKKVAVTSVIGAELFQEKFGNKKLGYQSPQEALPKVIEKMEAEKPDMMVLLSYAPLKDSKEIAEKFPQFQLVVSAGTENPHHKAEYVGKTRLLTLGYKGKHVAVVGFYPDKEQSVQAEIVDLDKDRFAASPTMRKYMQQYQNTLKGEYQNLLTPVPHPSGTTETYVGAKKCGSCHKTAYDKWKTTRHAHAFESLEKGRKGQEDTWVSRIHDPECLACHVTGWNPQEALPIRGGFTSQEETPHLKGQQCENCHGPGSEHTRVEELWQKDPESVTNEVVFELRRAIKRDKKTVEKTVCIKCHDYENSPKFDFEKYWPKVEHKGRN